MADYHLFYVETLASGEWIVPEEFIDPDAHLIVRDFTWMKRWAPVSRVFFGDRAPIPFRMGRPEWTPASALYRTWFPEGSEERDLEVAWLPYDELMVDSWDESWLTVKTRVPASAALLFGDGDQPFPDVALTAAGWNEAQIRSARDRHLASTPIDRTTGHARHEVDASHPLRAFEVTWRETVAGFLRDWRVEAFSSPRRYGSDDELRVVTIVG